MLQKLHVVFGIQGVNTCMHRRRVTNQRTTLTRIYGGLRLITNITICIIYMVQSQSVIMIIIIMTCAMGQPRNLCGSELA